MAFIIKRATIKQDGLYVTQADGDVHPLSFAIVKYEGDLESFLAGILNGDLQAQPAAKCNKVHLRSLMKDLDALRQKFVPSVSLIKDKLYGVDGMAMLNGALAKIGAVWLSTGVVAELDATEQDALAAVECAICALYEKKEAEMRASDAGGGRRPGHADDAVPITPEPADKPAAKAAPEQSAIPASSEPAEERFPKLPLGLHMFVEPDVSKPDGVKDDGTQYSVRPWGSMTGDEKTDRDFGTTDVYGGADDASQKPTAVQQTAYAALTTDVQGKGSTSRMPVDEVVYATQAAKIALPAIDCAMEAAPGHAPDETTRADGVPCWGATTGSSGFLALLPDQGGEPHARRYDGGLPAFLDALLRGTILPQGEARLDKLPMAQLVLTMREIERCDGRMPAIEAAEQWIREGDFAQDRPNDAAPVQQVGAILDLGSFPVSFQNLAAHDMQWLCQEAALALTGRRDGLRDVCLSPICVMPKGVIALNVRGRKA